MPVRLLDLQLALWVVEPVGALWVRLVEGLSVAP